VTITGEIKAPWPRQFALEVKSACDRSPDPVGAMTGFTRLAEARPDPPAVAALDDMALVFSASPYLTDLLLGDELLLDSVCSASLEGGLPDIEFVRRTFNDCPDTGRLRKEKSRLLFRIALADLARRASTERVVERLSDLADCTCQRIYGLALDEMLDIHGEPHEAEGDGSDPWSFAVIAMGKLGSRELNFSSDIDLIFVYSSEHGETANAERISGRELATRLARRLTRMLSERAAEGALYRVDLRLRPMGRSGDVATSMRAAEIYYESWGETWERQALLRARHCAGAEDLGNAFIEMVRPFVFRRYLDYQSLEAIGRIKDRIEAEMSESARAGDNVKLSPGGIREIEFTIQSLQLLHGGRDKSLRTNSTLGALERLQAGSYLNVEQIGRLRDAYLFMRDLENRLQMHGNLQTQRLPEEAGRMAVLARLMGVDEADSAKAAAELRHRYDAHRDSVREIYEKVIPRADAAKAVRSLPVGGPEWSSRDATLERLAEAGFRDPRAAYRSLMSIREDPADPLSTTTRDLFNKLAPDLVLKAAESPDPDAVLARLDSLVRAHGHRSTFFDRLRRRSDVLDLLSRTLGGSVYLTGILISNPELMDQIMRPDAVHVPRSPEIARDSLAAFLETAGDGPARVRELASARRANELAIGLRDLLQKSDVRMVCRELSNLADACLETALDLAREVISSRSDVEPADLSRFAVLALGSLGSGELTYNADLDLLFVFSAADLDDDDMRRRTACIRLAERVIGILSGQAGGATVYSIDARLRPDGSQGMIAMPAEAAADYYRQRAASFERQALLRLRLIAGDSAAAAPMLQCREEILFSKAPSAKDLESCAEIRRRYILEVAGDRPEKNLKYGPGGLLDAEYGAQLLALAHGHADKRLRGQSILKILDAARQSGLLSRECYTGLRDGWLTMKAVENKLRLTYERPRNVLPDPESKEAAFLARLLDWPEPGSFFRYLEGVRARVNEAYNSILDDLGIKSEAEN